MKTPFKKIILATIISCMVTASFADSSKATATPPAPQPDPSVFIGITQAINALTTTVKAVATAAIHDFNNMMFQVDNFFPNGANNNGNTQAQQTAQKLSNTLTQQQVTNALSQVPEQAIPASQLNDPTLTAQAQKQQNLLGKLTAGTPASDTLYSSGLSSMLAGVYAAEKPSPEDMHNNYFNFDTLIGPDAYDSNQYLAAQRYLQYLTQSYQPLTPGIDYAGLKQKLNSFDSAIDRARWLKENIIENPTYQQYQIAMRSNLAARSLALSNFNMLVAQRKAIPDLGTANGLPQDSHLPQGAASLQEAQNYAALKLVNNPQWYQAMKNASIATVAREQLLLMATLVKEQAQNEQYNQRLLATMSLLTLEANQTQQMGLQTKAQEVNQLWSNNSNSSDNSSDDSADSNDNDAVNAQQQQAAADQAAQKKQKK